MLDGIMCNLVLFTGTRLHLEDQNCDRMAGWIRHLPVSLPLSMDRCSKILQYDPGSR